MKEKYVDNTPMVFSEFAIDVYCLPFKKPNGITNKAFSEYAL